jgi:hypothetical protein
MANLYRFIGRYELLHGGIMPNIALVLSGGIHESYSIEIIRHLYEKKELKSKTGSVLWKMYMKFYDRKPEMVLPNKIELFEIIKFAIEAKNLVGCYRIEVN